LHDFLDSYLQFRHRWYDLPHRSPKGAVAGLVVGELELCRRVFMVLYRISSNKDPGAGRVESLSMKEHTALLMEKNLLDLPKLLDICAIYEHDNNKLTSSLVTNTINVQPNVLDGINIVIPQFLSIFHTMHDRCMTSLQVIFAICSYTLYSLIELIKYLIYLIAIFHSIVNNYCLYALFWRNHI